MYLLINALFLFTFNTVLQLFWNWVCESSTSHYCVLEIFFFPSSPNRSAKCFFCFLFFAFETDQIFNIQIPPFEVIMPRLYKQAVRSRSGAQFIYSWWSNNSIQHFIRAVSQRLQLKPGQGRIISVSYLESSLFYFYLFQLNFICLMGTFFSCCF